jgi:hypothetical protein
MPIGARNDYDVTVPSVELALTKHYHGLTIIAENGSLVGRIQSFTPKAYERASSFVYELNAFTFGRPVDIVPGKESGRTIECTRVEMWDEEFEIAFGPAADNARVGGIEWSDLCDQTRPFLIQEALFRGAARYSTWEYLGCWLTGKSYNDISAEGEAKMVASCQMSYVIRKRL